MDEQERFQKHSRQTELLYAAIGRFAVKFEHMCHAMSSGVLTLLQTHGLQSQKLGNAVLEGLTAEPLRRMHGAVVAEIRGDQFIGDEKKILTGITNRIARLTESRNDVIHRTWFVGWAATTDEDFSKAAGMKFKNTSKGVELRPLEYSAADFDSLSTEAELLTRLIQRLNGCLLLGKQFAPNFVLDADGVVTLPPGT